MTYKNYSDNHLVVFEKHNGPIFSRFDVLPDGGYICNGCMCYVGDNIIISTKNSTNIKVYVYDISEEQYSTPTLLSSTTSSYEITAMCPYDDTYFITALKQYDSGAWYTRIYKSTNSDLFYETLYEQPEAIVYSVTALAVTGNTLTFGAYINSNSSKIYSGTIPGSGEISTVYERESLSYKVTGLTYFSSTLMTAIQYGDYTRIYSGSTTDPISSIGTYVENYSNTNLISLESDSEFIFMVKDDDNDTDEKRTVYFSDSSTNMDDEIIYHSKWYTEDY